MGRCYRLLPSFNEINAGYFSPYNGVGLLREKNKPYNQSLVFQSLHHQFVECKSHRTRT